MKLIVSLIVGLIVAYLIFFKLDPMIVEWVIRTAEVSQEAMGVVRIILWTVLLSVSGIVTFLFSVAVGAIVYSIIDAND